MAVIEGAAGEFDIVLASASPRRRELLDRAGVTFRVHPVDADEELDDQLAAKPLEAVKCIAERKARAAYGQLAAPDRARALVIIASDTMVVLDGEIFGKPRDAADATRMLRALSGRAHDVNTAVSLCIVSAPSAEGENADATFRTFVDTTHVFFRDLTEREIADYIATGDPFDKAGSYGIQSGAGAFVDHIEGDLDTVIGLPVTRLLREFPDLLPG